MVAVWRGKFIAAVYLQRRNNKVLKTILLVCLAALLSDAVVIGFKDKDSLRNTARTLEQLQPENKAEIPGNTVPNAAGGAKLELAEQVPGGQKLVAGEEFLWQDFAAACREGNLRAWLVLQ